MGGWLRWLARGALAAAVLVATAPPAEARSRARVEWKRVEVPPGDDAARLEKLFRKVLAKAGKRADFGKARRVTLSARIVELTFEPRGDVLQVTCTMVGRLEGGPKARSRISYGGHPNQRAALEQDVLTMVASGLVTRLAEMARLRAEQAEREAKEKEQEQAAPPDAIGTAERTEDLAEADP